MNSQPSLMNSHPHRLAVLLPMIALLALAGCNSKADSAANTTTTSPRLVLAAQVEPAAQHAAVYTGVVAARTESNLGFRVAGKVIERKVDPGMRVARGDTLLVLDIEDFELALRAANNRVQAARAELNQARDDAQRYQRLVSSGAISKQIFDQSATRLRIAEADLAAASSDANQVKNRRSYSVLRADADGVVTEVRVDRGQVVGEGQVVARLAHDGAREAVIDIPETQRKLASNPAQAALFSSPAVSVPARLRELSAAADPATRTFRARYILDGASEPFPIGSTITLRLASDAAAQQVRVPLGALYDAGQGSGVWLIDNEEHVRFKPVQVVRLEQEHALLSAGVSSGQRVVALGAHLLHEGDPVRLQPGQALALANAAQGKP